MRQLAVALMVAFGIAGCAPDKRCATSDECFRGEACIDQVCQVPSAPDGDRDVDNEYEFSDSDPTSGDPACIVESVGNTCEDDSYEPNENPDTFQPLLWDNQSWCDGTELVTTQTSEALRLCAGAGRDGYRLMIDNRIPTNCLTRQFTWRIEVRIHTACVPEALDIVPYYSSPYSESRCDDDEAFRCAWSDDGQTYTIEFVRQPDQLMDINLHVAPANQRNDVQVDYDVVMTLIQ